MCPRCGADKPRSQWPRQADGFKARHCGCGSRDPANPYTRERANEANKRRRARLAAEAGRQYRTKAQIAAGVKLAVVYLDGKHKAALRLVVAARRTAAWARTGCNAHVRAFKGLSDAQRYRWDYANKPEFMLKERLRRQFRKKAEAVPGLQDIIGAALKHGGNSATVESVCGYSMTQLRQHLERQFAKGMTWQCWGRHGWHIDHILPRKCFDLTTIEGVQAYWSLSNLRPLWARKNLEKRDRVEFLC